VHRALAAASLAFVACRPDVAFSPATLADGVVGQPYRAEITIEQGETPLAHVSATGLPSGLSLIFVDHQASNVVSIEGTPREAGTSTVTIDAACYGTNRAGQRGAHTYRLVVR
jgi:hypothetical protein